MASTTTIAIAAGSTAAAITFAVVTIIGSASDRPDLGGPVVVETDVATDPSPTGDEDEDEG